MAFYGLVTAHVDGFAGLTPETGEEMLPHILLELEQQLENPSNFMGSDDKAAGVAHDLAVLLFMRNVTQTPVAPWDAKAEYWLEQGAPSNAYKKGCSLANSAVRQLLGQQQLTDMFREWLGFWLEHRLVQLGMLDEAQAAWAHRVWDHCAEQLVQAGGGNVCDAALAVLPAVAVHVLETGVQPSQHLVDDMRQQLIGNYGGWSFGVPYKLKLVQMAAPDGQGILAWLQQQAQQQQQI